MFPRNHACEGARRAPTFQHYDVFEIAASTTPYTNLHTFFDSLHNDKYSTWKERDLRDACATEYSMKHHPQVAVFASS